VTLFHHILLASNNYHPKANSDTLQNVIWAFGTVNPGSSSADANLQHHLDSGTFQLDLTKTISSNSSENPSPSSPTGSSSIPLQYYQKLIVAHAILCAVGFLAILPAGALFARYVRTVSPMWFKVHQLSQLFIGELLADFICIFLMTYVVSWTDHNRWGSPRNRIGFQSRLQTFG
jgi:hypothetical protein